MTHLFFVHSNATHRCALGVIQLKQLPGNDCVFVCARDFVCPGIPDEAVQSGSSFRDRVGGMGSVMEVLRSRDKTKAADSEITELAQNKPFHAYIPHSYYPPIQWALSHPLCQGFSYIEEGVTSYFAFGEIERAYPPRQPPLKAGVLCKLLYGKRLPKVYHFFQNGYSQAYGFSEKSFPGWPRRITLESPNYLAVSGNRVKSSAPILVFDAVVELGMVGVGALKQGVRDFLLKLFDTGVGHLRYKLHPGQGEESLAALREVLDAMASRMKLQELGRAVSLEEIFGEEECDVYVLNSAAGIYAAQSGLRTFTINAFVLKYDPGYQDKLSQLPACYSHFVKPAFEDVVS